MSVYSDPKLSDFQFQKVLGRGAFSEVWLAVHIPSSQTVAIKSIKKRAISRQGFVNLQREIMIMLELNHPNILKMYKFIETEDSVHLVLEYMKDGELFDSIVKKGYYGEQDASKVIKQILSGIHYVHINGVAHRDLKPENLLCDGDRVVVADFGLAKLFGRGDLLRTHVGTPNYAAPEIVRGDDVYDKAVDMWSIGVIAYVLLCGYYPFHDTEPTVLKHKIVNALFDFPNPHWSSISDSAKDFIRKLLLVDPKQRSTAEQALNHAWIINEGGSAHNAIDLRSSMELFNTQRRVNGQDINEDIYNH